MIHTVRTIAQQSKEAGQSKSLSKDTESVHQGEKLLLWSISPSTKKENARPRTANTAHAIRLGTVL